MNNQTEGNAGDRHLVKKVLSGNTNAFGDIIKQTEKLVAQIVFKMINNTENRKDIAQDVYVKAFQKLSTFKFQSKLSTWIGQIAYNSCLNYLEKKKLILAGDFFDAGNEDEAAGKEIYKTDLSIFEKERSAMISAAIEKLSPVYKTLITLYHNEELSYEEIGQVTGLPGGTVKNYLFRARKALREVLLKQYKKDELC